jgi:hypothetical protein
LFKVQSSRFKVTATGNGIVMRSQNVTASQKKRNIAATPYAFTEQGLAMLSGILNSDKAINVNIAIMRAFVMIRQYALTYKDLTDKLKEIKGRFEDIYEAIDYLLDKDRVETEQKQRKRISFYQGKTEKSIKQKPPSLHPQNLNF